MVFLYNNEIRILYSTLSELESHSISHPYRKMKILIYLSGIVHGSSLYRTDVFTARLVKPF